MTKIEDWNKEVEQAMKDTNIVDLRSANTSKQSNEDIAKHKIDLSRFITYLPMPNYLIGDPDLSDGYIRITVNYDCRPCLEFKSYKDQAYLCMELDQLKRIRDTINQAIDYFETLEGAP